MYRERLGLDTVLLTEVDAPQNYEEAVHGPQTVEWKRAMDVEIES